MLRLDTFTVKSQEALQNAQELSASPNIQIVTIFTYSKASSIKTAR